LAARPEDDELLQSAMQAHVLAGDFNAALKLARRLISVNPQNQQAHILLSVAAFKRAQFDVALEHVDAIGGGPLGSVLTPNMELWIALARNDEGRGAAAVKKLTRASLFAGVPLVQAARALEINGNSKAAATHYAEAVRAGAARYLYFVLSYGAFLERQNETERAAKLYEFYHGTHLEHAHVSAAQARLGRGEKPPIEANPMAAMAEAFAAISEAMQNESRFDLALGYLRLAQYLDGDNELIAFSVAQLLGARDRFVDAAVQFSTIDKGGLLYRDAQIQRAQMLFEAGAAEAAIAVLNQQLRLHPNDRDLLVSLGDLYRSELRFAEAENSYDAAVGLIEKERPRDWHLYFVRGMMRERLGDWDMAEIDLQRARKLSNDEPHVLNYLGYSWIDKGMYLDEGLKIIKQAVKEQPKNGSFVDSLGWAHFRLGNYATALKVLERASQLEPTDPVITDHLGDALWRMKREVEARYQWRKALAFEPTDEDRVKIERKLLTGLGAPEKKKPEAHMPRGGTAI
jgi:Flp pilus assembly protein TadD